MILVLGGAYQGKLEYVKNNICGQEAKVYEISQGQTSLPDEAKDVDVIYGMEKLTRACQEAGLEAIDVIEKELDFDKDQVLIFTDISAGLVPMDALDRAWREHNGRTMIKLTGHAKEVHRVFCGLGQRLK